jgi:hypothetical protein
MGMEGSAGVWWKELKVVDNLEETRVEGKIKIKWVLKKLCGIGVIGFIWIKIWQLEGRCESGNARSDSSHAAELLTI